MDHSLGDPLNVEMETAHEIAAEFSERVMKDSSGKP
jgi:hypothetical protein